MVQLTQGPVSVNKGVIDLHVENRSIKTLWKLQVIERLGAHCTVRVDFMMDKSIS